MYDLTDHALRRSIEEYSENSAVSRIARSIRYIYMATWLLLGKAPIVRVGGSKDLPLMQSGWAGEGGGGRIQGQSRVRRRQLQPRMSGPLFWRLFVLSPRAPPKSNPDTPLFASVKACNRNVFSGKLLGCSRFLILPLLIVILLNDPCA